MNVTLACGDGSLGIASLCRIADVVMLFDLNAACLGIIGKNLIGLSQLLLAFLFGNEGLPAALSKSHKKSCNVDDDWT